MGFIVRLGHAVLSFGSGLHLEKTNTYWPYSSKFLYKLFFNAIFILEIICGKIKLPRFRYYWIASPRVRLVVNICVVVKSLWSEHKWRERPLNAMPTARLKLALKDVRAMNLKLKLKHLCIIPIANQTN